MRRMWEATAGLVTDGPPPMVRAVWAAECSAFWANRDMVQSRRWALLALADSTQLQHQVGIYGAQVILSRLSDEDAGALYASSRSSAAGTNAQPSWPGISK
jgi:hypothetical protein